MCLGLVISPGQGYSSLLLAMFATDDGRLGACWRGAHAHMCATSPPDPARTPSCLVRQSDPALNDAAQQTSARLVMLLQLLTAGGPDQQTRLCSRSVTLQKVLV